MQNLLPAKIACSCCQVDTIIVSSGASEALLEEDSMGGSLLSHPHGTQTSLCTTWVRIWPAAVALVLSVGASMVVAPFFTYVPSSGATGDLLPQALFAVRTLSDIAGRLLPFAPAIQSKPGLLAAGVLRAALTPAFFWWAPQCRPVCLAV